MDTAEMVGGYFPFHSLGLRKHSGHYWFVHVTACGNHSARSGSVRKAVGMGTTQSVYETFGSLEQVAGLLLYTSFTYVYEAASDEVAGIIFGEQLKQIDVNHVLVPGQSRPQPTSLSEFVQNRHKVEVKFNEEIMSELGRAWYLAHREAATSGVRLPRRTKLKSRFMVPHVILLAACMETVVNRHLFHLQEAGQLEQHLYQSLDRAEMLPKIMFAFKEEITTGKLRTTNIKHLITLRNHAVHFKESSINAIEPTSEDLLRIWREVAQLFSFIEGDPTAQEVLTLAAEFIRDWLEPARGDARFLSLDATK
jgi:hypothetical protein